MSTRFTITNDAPDEVDRSAHYVSPVYVTLLSATTTITNLCLGAAAMGAIVFIHSFALSSTMKQHVYLCGIGYVILMAQAIQSLNPHSGWARLVRYQDRRVVHWMLQIVASITVVVGSVIRMMDVPNNFRTTHGILGLVSLILTILSMVGGIVNAYSSKLNINPSYLKIAHSCLGSLTLSSAFLCLCFAFNSTFRVGLGDQNADLAISVTVIALVGSLASPCIGVVRRIFKNFRSN
ncbi:uncharacterized protein LOC123698957 [Colias croceus]|uniref:uncharacterized protein LOC123698957 n=1 Tax=Colias crocea TaxID=72248 RepID=UPI001E28039E|nr:uncharacterized protein LOC123698957 [Colias croceus]